MVSGLLMELEDYNCWTIAEAAGHRGPHRLQQLMEPADRSLRRADACRPLAPRPVPHGLILLPARCHEDQEGLTAFWRSGRTGSQTQRNFVETMNRSAR
jgi:hypothetical protein